MSIITDFLDTYVLGTMTQSERDAITKSQERIYNRQIAEGNLDPEAAETQRAIFRDLAAAPATSTAFLEDIPTEAVAIVEERIAATRDYMADTYRKNYNNLAQEGEWLWGSLYSFPSEFGKTAANLAAGTGQAVAGAFQPLVDTGAGAVQNVYGPLFRNLALVGAVGLGLYALVVFTPELKAMAKRK